MVEINAFLKSRDGNKKISKHFRIKEFACHDGSDPIFIAPKLVEVLEAIREHYKRPIIINSAYRTPLHNKREGGSPRSQHMLGTAADIVVKNVPPSEVAKYARTVMKGFGGVGRYQTFTHVDVRETPANW